MALVRRSVLYPLHSGYVVSEVPLVRILTTMIFPPTNEPAQDPEDWIMQVFHQNPGSKTCGVCSRTIKPVSIAVSGEVLSAETNYHRYRLLEHALRDWKENHDKPWWLRSDEAVYLYDKNIYLCGECYNSHMSNVDQALKETTGDSNEAG